MNIRSSVISIVLILIGIGFQAQRSFGEMVVTDLSGRTVTIPQTPGRIVALSTGSLRLIVYLQATDLLVGVEEMEKRFPNTRPYWMAHPEIWKLPAIGPGGPASINKEPDLEKILSVQPDLIFISYMSRQMADAVQAKIGIPVVVISYGPFGSFDETVYDTIRLIGKILDRETRANAVVDFLLNARRDLRARVDDMVGAQKPSVYIGGIGFKGSQGIESTETQYAPFEWVNANNIAKHQQRSGHLFASKEQILSWNPDIIFVDSGGSERIRMDYNRKPGFYMALKAFQTQKIYTLHSFNWYMTNLGTVVANAYTVGKILYPDQFEDIDPAAKADEIYTYLVGKPVYRKMVKTFGHLSGHLIYK